MEEIELKLTEKHINIVLQALAEVPYKFSAPVLDAIYKQLPKKEEAKENDK